MILAGLILLVAPTSLLSQTLSRAEAESFVRSLLWNMPSLVSWFDSSSLSVSRRLGIEYVGVENKCLIAYDVDDSTKSMMRAGRLGYSITVDSLAGHYSRVRLTIEKTNDTREYFFRDKGCISPLAYFARNWTVVESEYFRFFLSGSTLFNAYCREQLEAFVVRMVALLDLNDREIQRLREEKIYYYLCGSEEEVQQLTGYRARGMYNLAYDAVVTTFNAHYHELLHLLINYTLRRLPLYTHPLLQEGFAVAYGGRGGMDAPVLRSLGGFLFNSRLVDLPSLWEGESFRQLDASLSYPAAGLYTMFLVESMGMPSYLRLYRAQSGSAGDQAHRRISPQQLPMESQWRSFLRREDGRESIVPDSLLVDARIISDDSTGLIAQNGEWYFFRLSDVALLQGKTAYPGYQSKAIRELLPGRAYQGEKYMIRATGEGISVYNLLTNNLVATYAASFTLPPRGVPRLGGRYCFRIRRGVFDEPLNQLPGLQNGTAP